MRVWVNCDGVLCFIKTLHKLCKAKPDNSTCALLNTILQMLQIAINNEKKCPDFVSIPLENYNINLKNVQRMMDNRLYIKFKHEDKKSQSFSEEYTLCIDLYFYLYVQKWHVHTVGIDLFENQCPCIIQCCIIVLHIPLNNSKHFMQNHDSLKN